MAKVKKKNMTATESVNLAQQATVLNPQQQEFLSYYLDVNSETFGNAYKSAIKAKYSEEYAQSITAKDLTWLAENVGDSKMLGQAVKNIQDFLEMNCLEDKIGAFGPIIDPKTKKRIKEDNVGKMKIKSDITKFVAERLGRKKFGQDKGNTIVPIQINFGDKDLQ